MKNIHAYTETGTVSSHPGYISINERTPTEGGAHFEVSVREDTGGGFQPAFARIWLTRGELIKLAKDINDYLTPEQDTPTAPEPSAPADKVDAPGIPREWVEAPDSIPKEIITACRDAICKEFGNNGSDGYYKRILAKVFHAAIARMRSESGQGGKL